MNPAGFFHPLPTIRHAPTWCDPRLGQPPHESALVAAQLCVAEWQKRFATTEPKMLGVLVCRLNGQLGYLQAFSGQHRESFILEGFAPPLCDVDEYRRLQAQSADDIAALTAELACTEAELAEQEAAHSLLAKEWADRGRALHLSHQTNKQHRAQQRQSGHDSAVLALQSQRDKTEWRQHKNQAVLALQNASLDAVRIKVLALEQERAQRSAQWMNQLFATYRVPSLRKQVSPLVALFPGIPPSGAGDCAAPKLLALAIQLEAEPLALAEVFYGESQQRRHGALSAPCSLRCGPLLEHMLGEPPQPATPPAALKVVFEDASLLVINKPPGLLSVPGKHGDQSVLSLLQSEFSELRLAHRLDRDTSGLLLAAKNQATYVALQRAFLERRIGKQYTAWVEGRPPQPRGEITLPLCPNIHDRPRQVVDFVHGRPARTSYESISSQPSRTWLRLTPHTGRTHQLRVHCADRMGLGCPIVGDPLYNWMYSNSDIRMFLHASTLELEHPTTKQWLVIKAEI